MHPAIQLIFDPQHDTHRALEVETAWRGRTAHGGLTQRRSVSRAGTPPDALVILNGPHTACQRWIQFEVMRAFVRGTPMLVVDVSCLRDEHKRRTLRGRNPFDLMAAEAEAQTLWLKEFNPGTQKWQASRASSSVPRYAVPYAMEGNGPWLLSSIFPIYRWTEDWGEHNLQAWVEQAVSSLQPLESGTAPALSLGVTHDRSPLPASSVDAGFDASVIGAADIPMVAPAGVRRVIAEVAAS